MQFSETTHSTLWIGQDGVQAGGGQSLPDTLATVALKSRRIKEVGGRSTELSWKKSCHCTDEETKA